MGAKIKRIRGFSSRVVREPDREQQLEDGKIVEQSPSIFQAIFEQAAVGMAYVEFDGKLLFVNQRLCTMLGYSVAELQQIPLFAVFHSDERVDVRKSLRHLERGKDTHCTLEKRCVQKDGTIKWFHLTASVHQDASTGDQFCFIVVFYDATERKLHAEVAFEEQRRTDELLSIASHELKSPLAAVKGNIQLAVRRLKKGWRHSNVPRSEHHGDEIELLQQADHQITRLNRLVSDLLDVSRIQSGKMEPYVTKCDLISIMQDAIDEQIATAPHRQIRFVSSVFAYVPIVAAQDRIGQVITNFISNALKFSSDERPVEVSIELLKAEVRLVVRDYGIGLPPDQQERIWERFYQLANEYSEIQTTSGLGLGLYISKMIIEQHHGSVGVESVPGEGAAFWFTLPLLETPVLKGK